MMMKEKQKTQSSIQIEIESEDMFGCNNNVIQYMVEPDASIDLD